MSALTQFAGRGLLQVRKFSPEVLIGVGVAGVVTAGVLAAKSTLKLEATVTKLEERKDTETELFANDMHDEQQHKKNLVVIQRDYYLDLVKLYGPSVTLGAFSIAALVGSHGIMRKRNIAAMSAYKMLESSFTEYRKRVTDEVGAEKEEDIRLGLRALSEDADSDTPMALEQRLDHLKQVAPYSVIFDSNNKNWESGAPFNYTFLKSQQTYANHRLQAYGHVFLNEVYEALGFPHTREGALVGWVRNPEFGDAYIDFGFEGLKNTQYSSAFASGEDNVVLLDFNVDGPIWDKI